MKYLTPRGNIYWFMRRVPKDVRPVIGEDHWRWTLDTDGKTEAEIRCRKCTVETDEIIAAVRKGSYRRYTDVELEDLAMSWSLEFQDINQENIARDMFPHVFETLEKIGDEAPSPIISHRSEIEDDVSRWLQRHGQIPNFTTTDWKTLIDACIDEYHTANPELGSDWQAILSERGFPVSDRYPGLVVRERQTDPKSRLSAVFSKYMDNDGQDLAPGTKEEYAVSVRRFISIIGDLAVADIHRGHAELYRDTLKQLPSRPPNTVRNEPIRKQVA